MNTPRLVAVAALDEHMLIGRDGDLPWKLPADLARFKKRTMGHPILMGRTTHASIGRALPGRRNLVLTRSADYHAECCEVFGSVDAALASCSDDEAVMVIGGRQIYEATLPKLDEMVLTLVRHTFDGDTWFPAFDLAEWRVVASEAVDADERNAYRQLDVRLRRSPTRSVPVPLIAAPETRALIEWIEAKTKNDRSE